MATHFELDAAPDIELSIIPSNGKVNHNILAYLTFAISSHCSFKCAYCGEGGETTASFKPRASLEFVIERAQIAYDYGIRKFRLTGGEPTEHTRFDEMVDFISGLEDASLLVNTHGGMILRKKEWLSSLKPNVRFAVSLDTLRQDYFDKLTGTVGRFIAVLEGIKFLADRGSLTRLNMVVHKENIGEVFSMIDFCRSLGCNLKLLEVSSAPVPFSNWEDLYVNLAPLEEELTKRTAKVESHQYSRSFGIPMPIYTIDGVQVTVKCAAHGTRYDTHGICKGCSLYPCHEGLYDMYLLPDGRLCGCRWSETSVARGENFREQLDYMVKAFQRAEWLKLEHMRPMQTVPSFVQHIKVWRRRGKTLMPIEPSLASKIVNIE